MEDMEEGGHVGGFGLIENEACCSVLDMLQRFRRRGWEFSQKRVAIVQAGDDQRLDQELRYYLCI